MKIGKLRKNFQKTKKLHESENQNNYSVLYCQMFKVSRWILSYLLDLVLKLKCYNKVLVSWFDINEGSKFTSKLKTFKVVSIT